MTRKKSLKTNYPFEMAADTLALETGHFVIWSVLLIL